MKNRKIGLLYLLPWLIGLIIFTIYPFISTLLLSFTNYSMLGSFKFIGLQNYIELFTENKQFLNSLWVTVKYAIFTVPFQLAVALFIAIILNSKLKGINLYRTVYYIPSILGGNVAISILWRFLFQSDGLINQILSMFNISPVNWLSNGNGAMFVLVILKVWQFGSAMVIFLAALKEIPQELYEAASVDGANKLRTFFKITVPLITPTIFFNLIMQLVNALQEFNGPYLITSGGPNYATYLTSVMIYDNAFKYFKMGYASAISWVLFIVIMVLTIIIFKTSNKWVYYSDGEGK